MVEDTSSRLACGAVGPAVQGDLKALDEAVKAAVDAGGQSETAAGFEDNEAVQGGSQGAGGVDGVVVCELIPGENRDDDVKDGLIG